MFKTITFLIISSSIFFCTSRANAQQGKIIGKLRDHQYNAVAFATLGLYSSADSSLVKGTLSDEFGDFKFDQLPGSTYFIKIESIGFETLITGPIVINDSKFVHQLNGLILGRSIQQLNSVTIVKKKPLIERRNDQTILNISNSTLAAGNTALEILSRAPGVTITNEGNISLRGKTGVSVMINGKSTYLSAEQLLSLLRSTSGNSIESIALISNPSTKYDAAGSGGIINIKLKKNENLGTNISLLLGTGYGSYYKSNGAVNFNHRNQKFNLFGNYDYGHNKEFEDLALKRSNRSETELTYFNQFGGDIYNRINNGYKIGLDYEIDSTHTIGFTLNGYANRASSATLNTTLIGQVPSIVDSTIMGSNSGAYTYQNQTYNINYKSVLDTLGREFNIDVDYAWFTNTSNSQYNNHFYDHNAFSIKPAFIFRNAAPARVKIWSAKADYIYPFSVNTKLEMGIKSSYVITKNNFIQENLQNYGWVNDPINSNLFNYKEGINAAYLNFKHQFKSLTVELGLRTELTQSEGYTPLSNQLVKRNYVDLFPNVNLSQAISEDHEFGISYSKRVDRPDYQSLNPFIYFADLYTYAQGNPYLNPQYTDALEFTYNYQQKWSASLGYSSTRDVITTTLLNDPIKKTLFILEQNLASQKNYNLNIGAPIVLTKWWDTNNDVTLYYTKFSSPNLMGVPFKSGKASYILNTTQTFTLNSSIQAELALDYQSAQVYGTYAVKPLYGVDLGISKSFAHKKATVKMAVNDIFNWRAAHISSAIALQDYHLYQKQESRIFRLSLSYNFGSHTVKPTRERSKSSDSEQSRVKSGH